MIFNPKLTVKETRDMHIAIKCSSREQADLIVKWSDPFSKPHSPNNYYVRDRMNCIGFLYGNGVIYERFFATQFDYECADWTVVDFENFCIGIEIDKKRLEELLL